MKQVRDELSREEMIDQLTDTWTNEINEMTIEELRNFAIDLQRQHLQRLSTRSLCQQISEMQ